MRWCYRTWHIRAAALPDTAPAPQSRKERDRQWIEGWLKTDLWPISQGPHPLAVNHMIHPEIYGEFQDRIEAKRRAPKSRGDA